MFSPLSQVTPIDAPWQLIRFAVSFRQEAAIYRATSSLHKTVSFQVWQIVRKHNVFGLGM